MRPPGCGGLQPGVLVLSGVWPLRARGDTVGMGLPQQSPGLWLSSGPKQEDFLGKYLILVGGRSVLASLPQGPRVPQGPGGTPAHPRDLLTQGRTPFSHFPSRASAPQSHRGLSHLCRGCAGPHRHCEGASDAGSAPNPGGWVGRFPLGLQTHTGDPQGCGTLPPSPRSHLAGTASKG